MKTLRTFIMILAMSLIAISCEKDEDFTQVSSFENALHNEVNEYRKGQGFENDLVLQFIMVKEAQDHANGLANGSITDPAGDINERWHSVESKLGVNNISNKANFSYQTDSQDAAAIVASWAADSIGHIILNSDLTQSGPGVGITSDGRIYIMHMLCKWSE
jgi:uncharacterized protein YkwD